MGRNTKIGVLFASLAFVALGCGGSKTIGKPIKKKKKMADKTTTKVVDIGKPFSHDSHSKLIREEGDRTLVCNDCHVLDGEVSKAKFPICKTTRMPFPTHDKCNGCHAKAFRTLPLQICTNCHTKNTISEQPPMKPAAQRISLRPEYSHELHISPLARVQSRFKKKKDCQFCHEFENGGEKVNLPAHEQCCECHTDPHVEPIINACESCHSRSPDTVGKPSSLEHFSHADHTLDPVSGATLDCERCHKGVKQAKTLAALARPAMATCVECHKGEIAFDYSKCLKCHAPGIEKIPLPPGHPK